MGAIQAWEEPNEESRHAGIDVFLATAAQGRGLGPSAIRAVAGWLISQRGHHRLTIDPAATNDHASGPTRSWASGRRDAAGVPADAGRTWVDGLLLELLADELIEEVPEPPRRFGPSVDEV